VNPFPDIPIPELDHADPLCLHAIVAIPRLGLACTKCPGTAYRAITAEEDMLYGRGWREARREHHEMQKRMNAARHRHAWIPRLLPSFAEDWTRRPQHILQCDCGATP
jgi:hypothetical protein